MGRDLIQTDSAPAGSLIGIGGIKDATTMIVNTGTLSNSLACPSFAPVYMDNVPILRVAVEPVELSQMEMLRDGLRLLNIADPVVEILDSATGELVVGACGEMHLQKCLDDLEKYYAKCKVSRSEPIVPFRETLITPPKVDERGGHFGEQQKKFMKKFNEDQNGDEYGSDDDRENETVEDREVIDEDNCTVSLWTPNRQSQVVVQAFPIPSEVREFLTAKGELLQQIGNGQLDDKRANKLRSNLMEAFHKVDFAQSSQTVDRIIALGPDGHGPNLLLNAVADYSERSNFWSQKVENLRNLDQQVLSGFQVATSAGPMMEEPMAGVGFRLLNWTTLYENEGFDLTQTSGQLISTMKEACRKGGVIHFDFLSTIGKSLFEFIQAFRLFVYVDDQKYFFKLKISK